MSTAGGERLLGIVEAYAGLGWHRTGSEVDRRTVAWFVEQIEQRGLSVELETLPFDRWVADGRLRADGHEIDVLPLQTRWEGSVHSVDPLVVPIDPLMGGFPEVVDAPIQQAIEQGADALVIVTEHPNGSLVGINRHLDGGPESSDRTPGFPTVLVAGRDLERCRRGPLELDLSARYELGETTNVVATRPARGGARDGARDRSVMVTTPLNGWFGCAGERGTGIAVLLDLIDRLLDRLPDRALTVVATGGHELGFFGAHRHVDGLTEPPSAVVHLGASIAVEQLGDDGAREFAATRSAMTSVGSDVGREIEAPLERARLPLTFDAQRWIGEANAWHRLEVPILSISGAGIDFHTPEDTPERVTSSRALAIAADAIADAALAFLRTFEETS